MRILSAIIAVLILGGCSSALLAPDYVRQVDHVEKIGVKQKTAYQLALRWFDKNLRPVPGKAREQDPSTGSMRMEAAFSCNTFRKDNDLKEYFLTFALDFESSPGFISLHFKNLRMENAEGELVSKHDAQLSSPQNVDKIRPCLKKMVASVSKAVESNTLNW